MSGPNLPANQKGPFVGGLIAGALFTVLGPMILLGGNSKGLGLVLPFIFTGLLTIFGIVVVVISIATASFNPAAGVGFFAGVIGVVVAIVVGTPLVLRHQQANAIAAHNERLRLHAEELKLFKAEQPLQLREQHKVIEVGGYIAGHSDVLRRAALYDGFALQDGMRRLIAAVGSVCFDGRNLPRTIQLVVEGLTAGQPGDPCLIEVNSSWIDSALIIGGTHDFWPSTTYHSPSGRPKYLGNYAPIIERIDTLTHYRGLVVLDSGAFAKHRPECKGQTERLKAALCVIYGAEFVRPISPKPFMLRVAFLQRFVGHADAQVSRTASEGLKAVLSQLQTYTYRGIIAGRAEPELERREIIREATIELAFLPGAIKDFAVRIAEASPKEWAIKSDVAKGLLSKLCPVEGATKEPADLVADSIRTFFSTVDPKALREFVPCIEQWKGNPRVQKDNAVFALMEAVTSRAAATP